MKKIAIALSVCLFLSNAWAEDPTINYSQKTLPNGDVESTFASSDGSKVTQVQHKDGSVESHLTQPKEKEAS